MIRSFPAHVIFGVLLIIGGLIHWLIIFGYLEEKAPLLLTMYFHSLAVVDIVAGVGLLLRRRFAYLVSVVIALTQLLAHGYMIYLDVLMQYGSGLSVLERVLDMVFAVALLYFCICNVQERR